MYCRISEDGLTGPGSLPARLKALPSYAPPSSGWQDLASRLAARRRRFYAMGSGLALAASVVVAVSVVLIKPVQQPIRQPGAAPAPVASSSGTTQVAQLIDRSQALERELSSARPQVVVWNSGRETRAAALEQRLRMVDAQLNYSADSESAESLWRERVRLMNALVDLHKPQSQAPGLMYASFQY